MSNNLAQLVVEIAADMARFQNDMRTANRTANDTMQRMAGDVKRGTTMIENSLSLVSKSIVAGFSVGAVVAFTKEVAQAGLVAEKLQMQFKAVAGSSEAASREMAYIRNVSGQLGLDFENSATAYAKFLASTRNTSIEGDQARKVFEAVSKATTAMSLSADEANGIFLALSQMMSKGKVSAEELNGQLGERLPGALKLAADGMGLTTAELMKQMQEGKIMSADLLPKLAEQLEKTYGKAAEEASHKGQAGINRFNNEIKATASAIGQFLMPAIQAAADKGADLLRVMRDTGSSTKAINDKFALPEDIAIVSRNMNIDPQRSRAEADRRAAQETINAQRAVAEKATALKADQEKAAKAAEAAAEKQRIAYNQGVQAFNRLVDAFNQGNPSISATEKAIAKVREEVAQLSKEHPEQAADAQKLGKRIEDQLRLADAIKIQNAEMRENIRLMEEQNKDFGSLSVFGQGLGGNYLTLPSVGGTLGKDGRIAGGMPKLGLTGASETGGLFGHDTSIVDQKQKETDQLLEIEKRYNQQVTAMKLGAAQEAIGIMRQTAGDGMAMQIAGLAAQKAIAIAQIKINTEMAASAALAAPPIGLGPIAGQGLAAEIRAMGYVSMGIVAASAVIEGMQISGKRAAGGPVRAGESYLVGERGPEIWTAGADGYVTPNDRLGGLTFAPVWNVDARGSTMTEAQWRAIAQQEVERGKAAILNNMNRGGTFAVASGRR